MTETNSPSVSNVPLSGKEGILIDTRSIAERVQAQVEDLVPDQIARQQGNIFFYTISRLADIVRGTNMSEMSNLVDAMKKVREGADRVSPGITEPANIQRLAVSGSTQVDKAA